MGRLAWAQQFFTIRRRAFGIFASERQKARSVCIQLRCAPMALSGFVDFDGVKSFTLIFALSAMIGVENKQKSRNRRTAGALNPMRDGDKLRRDGILLGLPRDHRV